jgi:hypothetical protein
VHSLDFILRTCTGSSEEDPIAFKQLLSKLHKAIGVVLQLCREEVFANVAAAAVLAAAWILFCDGALTTSTQGKERLQALSSLLVLINLAADLLQELSTQASPGRYLFAITSTTSSFRLLCRWTGNYELFSGFLESFLSLASLPWDESKRADSPEPCDLTRYPIRIVSSCLRLLCWLPNSFAVKSRKAIFRSSLRHPHLDVRLHTLLLLPLFISRLSRPNVPKFLLVLKYVRSPSHLPDPRERISKESFISPTWL